MDDTCVHIHADMEFDTVLLFVLPSDTYVIPDAAVTCSKPGTINGNIHTFSSEKSCYSIHHFSNIGDGEFSHPSMDDRVTWEVIEVVFECFTFFQISFDTIIGLIESYFEDTTCCYLFWIMSSTSMFAWFPWS